MAWHFDHRWSTYDDGEAREVSLLEKQLPSFEPTARYWVPSSEVEARLADKGWTRGWLMGWRKITNATNERTLIPAILPRAAIGDSMPLILPTIAPRYVAALLANVSSLVLDFIARQKIGGTNFTFQYLFQLAVLPPHVYSLDDLNFLVPRVLELTYTSHSMAPFARDLGYEGPPYRWDEDRRAQLRAELDAWYARAYGLTRDELRYILDPADVRGPDYPSETFRVLKKNEIARFGEYRTARLVLAAYDQLTKHPVAAE
jgi:hypothetical protein